MDEIARLRQRGHLYDAYVASRARIAAGTRGGAHPFRDDQADLDQARLFHEHGVACWQVARFDEAERALERAYRVRCDRLGVPDVESLDTLERMAALADYQGRGELADSRFSSVIDGLSAALGEAAVRVMIARRNHAASLRTRGRLREARLQLERARPLLEAMLADEHADWVDLLKVDAFLMLLERNADGALRRAEEAANLAARRWESDHPYTAAAELVAARAEATRSKFRAARKRLPRIVASFEGAYGPLHPLVGIARGAQARTELWANELERAEAYARDAIAVFGETYRGASLTTLQLVLHEVLARRGKLAEAMELAGVIEQHAREAEAVRVAKVTAKGCLAQDEFAAALPWVQKVCAALGPGDDRAEWETELARVQAELGHVRD